MAYVTHEDIRKINCFSEDTLLAVKAPYGSTLEVPDPDEGMPPGRRRYEIQLSSRSGPIDVYLIQDNPAGTSSIDPNPNSTNTSGRGSNATLANQPPLDPTIITGGEEALKHFQLPSDPYHYELRPNEGIAHLYEFDEMFGDDLLHGNVSRTSRQ